MVAKLSGSRIRERRIQLGVKQSMLAHKVGISSSYLNLIEHNRRRIAGKLIASIASELDVDPAFLEEGAQNSFVGPLREAAASGLASDLDAAFDPEEFARRFPEWADLLLAAMRRVRSLERQTEALSDRLTHDPELAASLHEVLTTVTAIKSTAGILAETKEIEPEWRDRFHRNINEDSARLAERATTLVRYLDADDMTKRETGAWQDEVSSFLTANKYHFPVIEERGRLGIDEILASQNFKAPQTRTMLGRILDIYADDAAALPLEALQIIFAAHDHSPAAVARESGVPMWVAMRRLSHLPHDFLGEEAGLIVIDAAGTLLYRKPIGGFRIPRYGTGCAYWPVYRVQGHPFKTDVSTIKDAGNLEQEYLCVSACEPKQSFDPLEPLLTQSYMYITRNPLDAQSRAPDHIPMVGGACRVCPVNGCKSRSEPSILLQEF